MDNTAPAPYGFKPDGTPRKRPGRSGTTLHQQAKQAITAEFLGVDLDKISKFDFHAANRAKQREGKMQTQPTQPKTIVISTDKPIEAAMMEAFDKQLVSLDKERAELEKRLKEVKERGRALARKRARLQKALA